jgi:hypothetical protein
VVAGGAKNGIVLRKTAAEGRGARPGSSVTSVFGTVPRGTPPTCHGRDRRRACRRRQGPGRVLRLPPRGALALAGADPACDRPVQVRG